jgi:hypothetical protein
MFIFICCYAFLHIQQNNFGRSIYHDKTKLHEIASQTLASPEEFWHKELALITKKISNTVY